MWQYLLFKTNLGKFHNSWFNSNSKQRQDVVVFRLCQSPLDFFCTHFRLHHHNISLACYNDDFEIKGERSNTGIHLFKPDHQLLKQALLSSPHRTGLMPSDTSLPFPLWKRKLKKYSNNARKSCFRMLYQLKFGKEPHGLFVYSESLMCFS